MAHFEPQNKKNWGSALHPSETPLPVKGGYLSYILSPWCLNLAPSALGPPPPPFTNPKYMYAPVRKLSFNHFTYIFHRSTVHFDITIWAFKCDPEK